MGLVAKQIEAVWCFGWETKGRYIWTAVGLGAPLHGERPTDALLVPEPLGFRRASNPKRGWEVL